MNHDLCAVKQYFVFTATLCRGIKAARKRRNANA